MPSTVDLPCAARRVGAQLAAPNATRAMPAIARVAKALFRAFESKFDPEIADREKAIASAREELGQALDGVRNLLDDEVLRALANLIDAAERPHG